MIFGAIPPPRNFAKIRTRGGRGLLPVQPKDSIPPWGHTGARRARRGRFSPESSGRRRTGGGVPRRARRGRRFAGARRAAARASFRRGAAGEKARFCLIRKRFFPGAALVKSELFYARILVASVGLLFQRRRVMNVSRRAGRAKSPAGKRNTTQRKERTP